MIIRSLYQSPLGNMALVSDGGRLMRLTFNVSSVNEDIPVSEDGITTMTKRELDGYFSRRRTSFDIPLLMRGTPFQMEVWSILSGIPYGKTMTYGEIASFIAERRGMGRMSARSVGGAAGSNLFPIIIPCHRVLGKGGVLVGYSEGIERKKGLLDIEGIAYRN